MSPIVENHIVKCFEGRRSPGEQDKYGGGIEDPEGFSNPSQANSAPEFDVQETPSVIQVEILNLEEKLQKLGDGICEETKQKFYRYFVLFEKQLELQESEFHLAIGELTARVDTVDNSLSDSTTGLEPEELASLKLSLKKASRNANQALQSLSKSRDNIDDQFDRAAQNLLELELAASQPTSKLDLGRPTVCVDFPDRVEKNPGVRRSFKSKSSRPKRRKRGRSRHCSGHSKAHDSSSESCGSPKKGDHRSSNHSGNSDKRSEERIRYSSSKKTRPEKRGVTSSASRRDRDAAPEDISTRCGPR